MIVDAVLSPAEIAQLRPAHLNNAVCVVFDVLRATSTIITAFAHGAQSVTPVSTIEEALAARTAFPNAILAGERHGDRIEGFDRGNSPEEFTTGIAGRDVITTTTNGTVALRACVSAQMVFAGALLNLNAVAEVIRHYQPERVLLVCAGTFETFALEDAYAAGRLARLLASDQTTDSAKCVMAVAQTYGDDCVAALTAARNGQALLRANRQNDLKWCARFSIMEVVPQLDSHGVLRCPDSGDKG
jgi:2-phosphosulfolactate phosphatase